MKKLNKFLSVLLVACMLLGMLPAINVAAADADVLVPGNFMEIAGSGNNRYLSTVGSNAFNVFMYDNTFSGTFGDQHMGGIEFSMNGTRIATNGDLHLLPTPEQWDATPAPSRGNRNYDSATNVITVSMSFNPGVGGTLNYDLVATPTEKGMCLQMILKSDMPTDLIGKARFNLELLPASFQSKTFQADINGDGVYDSFGTFPLHAQDAMVETERANLPGQAWYVKEWNADRGNAQPTPFATAMGYTLAPEDSDCHITVTSQTGDKIELYDGRNRAQNGWYVLSTLISATKAGEVAAQWDIRPDVEEGWVRTPNVGFSQAGYTPNQEEKYAVIELDKWDNDYPKTASLYRVNADGSETLVCEKTLGSTSNWMRYKYARFDFSEVKEAGLYRIHYGDQICEVFPIATNVYDNIWQSCLSGFLTVQMDHIEVREGYKIWHGASHMDDGRIPPSGVSSWFDGMQPGNVPSSVLAKYKNDEHVPGLNQGGWFDAGDFDLQMSRNYEVLGYLWAAAEAMNNMDNYDTLAVSWNEATGGTAEMHRPDGVPDVIQHVIHGSKQILAQYEALGGCGGTMETRSLRQYTHLGDPSSDTDGYIYDPTLGEDEIVERDGLVYSGVNDDRYLLMAGGGGSFSTSMWSRVTDFAATAYLAAPYYPDYAVRIMNAAIKIMKDERSGSIGTDQWDQLVQFTLASAKMEELGLKYDDCETYSAQYFRDILDTGLQAKIDAGFGSSGGGGGWGGWGGGGGGGNTSLLYLIPLLGDEYKDKLRSAASTYAASNSSTTNDPYGLAFTSGASWGASPNTFSGMRTPSLVYYNFPEECASMEKKILTSVNYLLGRHPNTNSSWISGVGTKSSVHPYNSNRAEESFIPGSILPGHITFSDYAESLDNFSFLWFEGESIINYQSQWIAVGLAASKIGNKEPAPAVAETKDFESSCELTMVKRETTSYFGSSVDGYLADDGFNVLMYSTTFDRTFGDQHCAGIELIQNGRRIATNGDIHLLPTPEQWDATPAPTRGTRTFDDATNTITVPMALPEETLEDGTVNAAVNYQIIAEPEKGGVKLTLKLDEKLPEDLVGKAGFNLEFLPAVYISKSIMADSDGDGKYDAFRTFPLTPFDEMEELERARTANQLWYVQDWNEDRGDAQPLPLATGTKMTFAAEDDDYRIRISSEDGLALYDGRNRAQNGWFVLRTLIPADKTEIVWHISPDTKEGWTREPNITHNQAGYEPELSKVAVIELDANYKGGDTATLKRLNEDGTYTAVYTGELGEAEAWQRYNYRKFDFSSVKASGTYVIDYDGFVSDEFPIIKHAYAHTWQASVGNFLAGQMDHVKVREAYKIWHNISHYDDALMAPLNVSWFDGWSMRDTTDAPYEPGEHIDGLNVGGFYDAGDFDIQTNTNIELINYLSNAYQVFGNDYDTLDCNWDTRFVELHRPDGVADIPQLVKHATLQILAQMDAAGFTASVIEVPSLRQYTHLGDGAKDTDGKVYDPTLGEGEVNGLKSGKDDDRRAFFGTKSASSNVSTGTTLAQAADVIKTFDEATAQRCIDWAEKIWVEDAGEANWGLALELFKATGKEVYKNYVTENFDTQMAASSGGWFSRDGFGSSGYKAGKVLDMLDETYTEKYLAAAEAYTPSAGFGGTTPFGVSATMGMWGGAGTVVGSAATVAFIHKYAPEQVSADAVFNVVNYILGTHPYNSTSYVSAVGKKSVEKGYGNNRADRYYIAGGLVPGYVTIAPDFPEHMDDYNFLWFENEYCIAPTAQWVFIAQAAEEYARESDVPCEHEFTSKVTEPTCTKGGYTTYFCNKCFESYVGDETEALGHTYGEGKVTRKPTTTREGVMTYACVRCGATKTESIPKLTGPTEKKTVTIDFTKPEDASKFTVTGGDAAIVEGEGLTLVSTNTCIEPAKNQRAVVMGEDNVIHIPVEGDWTATFEFDFNANGSSGGYEFFGFYAAMGGDYKNMVGIRGGNGGMQDFLIQDGTVTQQEQKTSSPGLTSANTHWYRIEKSADSYICYRSSDGENFDEMFSFDGTNIEADEIVIDAYSGMATGYTYILKYFEAEMESASSGGDTSAYIDFTKPEDAVKFEMKGSTGVKIVEGEGLTLVTTRNAIETCNGQNDGDQANTPEDLVYVPMGTGDWTATLEYDFNLDGASNGYYQFFGFFATEGEDYQNMVGIRGGDKHMQDFLRVNGEITADTDGIRYEPGLAANGTYWYRISKIDTSYYCEVSTDGENYTEMFSFEDTGIKADGIVIDAYTGMTEGYAYTLKFLEIEGADLGTVCQHEHTEIKDAKEPTCTETGSTGDTWCKDCGKKIKSGTVIAAKGHTWDNGKVTKEATCKEAGEKLFTCTVCKEIKTESIAKLAHTWDEGKVTKEATCKEAGEKTFTCSACKETKTESIAKLDHTWGEWVVTKAPTTAEEGEKTSTCSVCGETKTEKIEKLAFLFDDVKDEKAFYYESVYWAVGKGITAGTDANHFTPDAKCTRGQAVTFLWRAAGSPEVEGVENPFVDIKETDFYYKAVLWAVKTGVTTGLDKTHFGPDNKLTRGQFVTFLWRAKGAEEATASADFTDVPASKYCAKAVAWAVEKGITAGTDATHFSPDAKCTRGQVVTFLARAYK